MDLALIRTFIAVADTGSFVAASSRLFVTQSAVSLRIQRLENSLGKPLFIRSKAGVGLTPAGQAFERYAVSMVKLWEEARQQVAVPDGYDRALTIGAQYSLWPRLGFRWIDALQKAAPDLALRAELGMPDRLTRFLIEGVVQVALTYMPQHRPGLTVVPVMDDELILVSAFKSEDMEAVAARYVFMDWGPEFTQAHALGLPELAHSGTVLSLGALGVDYIVSRDAAAYLPARAVGTHLDNGNLHLVPAAPRFPYPIWAVFRDDLPDDLTALARSTLASVGAKLESAQEDVLDTLADISDAPSVPLLGEDI